MNKNLKLFIEENLEKDDIESSPKRKNHFLDKITCFMIDEDEYDNTSEKGQIYDYEKNHDFENNDILNKEYDIEVPSFLNKRKDYNINNKPTNIKQFIESNENNLSNFQSTLFKMIDERNLIDADVYNKVHIDRRLFAKIRNDNKYHPSKETVLLLGFSMELTIDEIIKLLDSASYSLPKNNYYDLIIRFCFMNGIYKIKEVNDLLDEYHCKLFNY